MCFFKKRKLNGLLKKLTKLHQLRDSGGQSDIKREADVLIQLARFYEKNQYNPNFPNASVLAHEYYRAAGTLDDRDAEYRCSKLFFDKAKFWEALANDLYGDEWHKKQAQDHYAEAFRYAKLAEMHGSALAKRLQGLAYIHGWGVEKNTSEGFKQVIDSIEMEGAWDRATKIFEDLKLNSPEFFAALMAYQSGKK